MQEINIMFLAYLDLFVGYFFLIRDLIGSLHYKQ